MSSRIDAYGDDPDNQIGLDDFSRIQDRERQMEGQQVKFSISRSSIKEEPQKIVVEQVPNYKSDADFQIEEPQKKRRRKKHHHQEAEGAEGENAAPE